MTDHLRRRRLFDGIPDESERRNLITQCALDDTDRQILTMRYIKHQDFGYIADALGLSYPAVIKRHRKALVLVQKLAAERVKQI